MHNIEALKNIDRLMIAYKQLSDKLCSIHSEKYFESNFGHWDIETYVGLRNSFFHLVTGEPDYFNFFDRFGTPGHPQGKPIAWEKKGATEDVVNELIYSSEPINDRVKEIKRLHKKLLKIEKEFNK